MGNVEARYPPNGWTKKPTRDDGFEFHREDGLVVKAERLDGCVERPGLSLAGGWELTCERYIDEQRTTTCIGYVTTRTAALNGLFEIMETVNELSDTHEHAVRSALKRITLQNTVPRTGERRPLG